MNEHCVSGNFAPHINASAAILVTIGEEFTYNVLVNDSNGDDITVSSSLNSSADITGPNVEGEVNITFTLLEDDIPQNATDFSFVVRAKVCKMTQFLICNRRLLVVLC